MAVTKDLLDQYFDLKQEEIEVNRQIDVILSHIDSCEAQIYELERETVLDKVYGGYGGNQGFTIEGYDERDLAILRKRLISQKDRLTERLQHKQELKDNISINILEIDKFMNTISDSVVRRIIYWRYIEHMTWNRVADKIGGNNTEDSVKKIFYRFMEDKNDKVVPNVTDECGSF